MLLAAIDQRHLGAEAVEDAGELHRDVAAALDQDALGQFLQVERLVRRDDVLEAGDLGAEMRRGAGGDQDRLGAHRLAGREQAHGVRVLEHGAALHDRDLGALQIGRVGRLEPGDLAVLVGDQRRPVERRLGQRPAVAGGVLELVGKARRIDQELLRHAAADHAGAADPVFLGHHDARAVAGRDPRGAHAARACTDDEQIDVVISHARPAPRCRCGSRRPLQVMPRFFISARKRARTSSPNFSCQPFRPAMASSKTSGSTAITFLPVGDR